MENILLLAMSSESLVVRFSYFFFNYEPIDALIDNPNCFPMNRTDKEVLLMIS